TSLWSSITLMPPSQILAGRWIATSRQASRCKAQPRSAPRATRRRACNCSIITARCTGTAPPSPASACRGCMPGCWRARTIGRTSSPTCAASSNSTWLPARPILCARFLTQARSADAPSFLAFVVAVACAAGRPGRHDGGVLAGPLRRLPVRRLPEHRRQPRLADSRRERAVPDPRRAVLALERVQAPPGLAEFCRELPGHRPRSLLDEADQPAHPSVQWVAGVLPDPAVVVQR